MATSLVAEARAKMAEKTKSGTHGSLEHLVALRFTATLEFRGLVTISSLEESKKYLEIKAKNILKCIFDYE